MDPASGQIGDKVLSVAELTRAVKGLLEEAFPHVWVAGEIAGYRPASSGHVYFTLQDSEAKLGAVIWRSTAQRLGFEPREGLEVIARGRLDVYLPQGTYKLIVEELSPKGIGARELALRQLKEKLQKLGYFDPQRKRALPRFPRRLALVTSPTGAAVRDMLEVLTGRWPGLGIWICPVPVQGEGAADKIAAEVDRLSALRASGKLPLDVIIIGRGGGSSDDLWAFNGESLAHAIFRSAVPVVSAVGHEIDVTIADMVADRRALTPTEAATQAVPDSVVLVQGLEQSRLRLREAMARKIERLRNALLELSQRRVFRQPLERIRQGEQFLDERADRLGRAARQRLLRSREQLEALAGRLDTLSPLNVLARGYSLTRREADGIVVRSSEQVKAGDRLTTVVEHGRIISRVEEIAGAPGVSVS